MEVKDVTIDRINLRVSKVAGEEWQRIIDGLFYLTRDSKIVNYNVPSEKLGIGEYRHSIHIDVSTDRQGAMYLGFQNNGAKLNSNNIYDMKIEFNPSKSTDGTQAVFELLNEIISDKAVRLIELDVAIDVPNNIYDMKIEFNPSKSTDGTQAVFELLNEIISDKAVRLIELDVAIDVPLKHSEIYSVNVSGRNVHAYATTRYFGQMHTDGYLKVYDKRKERLEQNNEDIGHELTRIEFTVRPNGRDGVGYQRLLSHEINYDKLYRIGSVNEITDFYVKCVVLALMSSENTMTFKNVPRLERKKIKAELDSNVQRLYVDDVFRLRWEELVQGIKKWFFNSADLTELELILGKVPENQKHKKRYKKSLSKISLADLD